MKDLKFFFVVIGATLLGLSLSAISFAKIEGARVKPYLNQSLSASVSTGVARPLSPNR